jgi:hypothetical protein
MIIRIKTIFIHNKLLPLGSFKAIACYPFLFFKGAYPSGRLINHELIHFAQQKELFLLGFYLLYLFFWLRYGYVNNPFEREALINQSDEKYLESRMKFGWEKYC